MSGNGRPLAGLRVSLVGSGRVGASAAGWLTAAGAELATLAGRTADPFRAEALGFRAAAAVARLATVGDDLLVLAVPDDALEALARGLAARPQAAVVLHTSGSRGAGALAPLRRPAPEGNPADPGTAVGALHPLRAFATPLPDPAAARGMVLAFDGDAAAAALAARLADAWAARLVPVPEEVRLLYHFAATLAAGGVVTLLAAAADLARRAGLDAAVAAGYVELARGAVAAAAAAPTPADAITGPLARGDADLVRRELAAVAAAAPDLHPPSLLLARLTLAELARTGRSGAAQATLDQELADDTRRRGFLDPPRGG